MSDLSSPTVPSTPDPTLRGWLYEFIQDGLGALGVLGYSFPGLTDSKVQVIASVAAFAIAGAMSAYDKFFRQPAQMHAVASASVRLNRAVQLR
jgi:hypothetical protein